ncbi:hypothetical protein [Solitalea koreensis]|uniref:Uncharacterized protein n=1 Tax=Solitalea koreensis TaxID=543615 RepID=A0A521BM69_9SPHI|nr:hypothetical protein [Solitalea koreensis]SMO48244.1 hypothetical protein SAMN06265350_102335 [Solitalea koreensis]
MRNQLALTSIFPAAFEPVVSNKGKRNMYAVKRDECMAYRFYYHYHLQRCRFDDAIANMEHEFWLSGSTITNYLTRNNARLKEIIAQKPGTSDLKKLYPSFSW